MEPKEKGTEKIDVVDKKKKIVASKKVPVKKTEEKEIKKSKKDKESSSEKVAYFLYGTVVGIAVGIAGVVIAEWLLDSDSAPATSTDNI